MARRQRREQRDEAVIARAEAQVGMGCRRMGPPPPPPPPRTPPAAATNTTRRPPPTPPAAPTCEASSADYRQEFICVSKHGAPGRATGSGPIKAWLHLPIFPGFSPGASSCPRCGAGCSPVPPPAWPAAPRLRRSDGAGWGSWRASRVSWQRGARCEVTDVPHGAPCTRRPPTPRAPVLVPNTNQGEHRQGHRSTQHAARQARTRRLDVLGRPLLVAAHRHLLLQLLHLRARQPTGGVARGGQGRSRWCHRRRVMGSPLAI